MYSFGIFSIETLSLLVTSIFCLYLYLMRNADYWKKRGIPFEKPLPLFGNVLDVFLFRTTLPLYLAKLYKKSTSPVYGIFLLSKPSLVLCDPDVIKSVLIKDFNHFNDRNVAINERDDPVGTYNLFVMKNPDWKILRSKLSPTFTSGKIKTMFPLIQKIGQSLQDQLRREILKPKSEIKELSAKFTTDVITSCAFGIEANSFVNENSEFRQVGRKLFDFNVFRALSFAAYFFFPQTVPLFKLKLFEPTASAFLRKAFNHIIVERENTGAKRNDMIDLLIQLKNSSVKDQLSLEGDRLVAQAAAFFAAGFETTANAISFSLYELALNPDVQAKLREEIYVTIENHGGITYEAIMEMKYLTLVISEAMRKYPPLPFIERRCTEDYQLPGTNVVVEKGTPIFVPNYAIHNDPKYFPDPEKFDPDRFLQDDKSTLNYLPFGAGPRNCVGERFGMLTSKIGLVYVLSKFKLERISETQVPIKTDPRAITMTCANGIWVKISQIAD